MREPLAALQSSQVVQQELQSTHLALEAPLGLSAMAAAAALALAYSESLRTPLEPIRTEEEEAAAVVVVALLCKHSGQRSCSLERLELEEMLVQMLEQVEAAAVPLLYTAAATHQEPRKEEA